MAQRNRYHAADNNRANATLAQENFRLTCQRDALLTAAKLTLRWLELSAAYRNSELAPIGNLRAAIKQAEEQ